MERRSLIKAIGGSAAIGLTGCLQQGDGGGSGDSTDSGTVQFSDPFRVGIPAPVLFVMNFAVWPGFHDVMSQEEDVETQMKGFNSYTAMSAGLLKEEVGVGFLTLPAIAKARAQNLPIKAVAGFQQQYVFPLIVKNDIESWDDLEGKTLAVHSPQAMSTAAARHIVKEEMGDVDAVNYTNIFGSSNRVSAIESGQVDASVVLLDAAYSAELNGSAKIFARPWEYDSLKQQTAAAWVKLGTTLQEENGANKTDKIVEHMLSGYEKTYQTDPQEVVTRGTDMESYAGFKKATFVEALKVAREIELWPKDGGLDPKFIENAQDTFVDTGLLKEENRVTPEELVDDRFLP